MVAYRDFGLRARGPCSGLSDALGENEPDDDGEGESFTGGLPRTVVGFGFGLGPGLIAFGWFGLDGFIK